MVSETEEGNHDVAKASSLINTNPADLHSSPMYVEVPINGQVYLVEAKHSSICSIKRQDESTARINHNQIVISSSSASIVSANNGTVVRDNNNMNQYPVDIPEPGTSIDQNQNGSTSLHTSAANFVHINTVSSTQTTNLPMTVTMPIPIMTVPLSVPVPVPGTLQVPIELPIISHCNTMTTTATVKASLSSPYMSKASSTNNNSCSSNLKALNTLNADHDYLNVTTSGIQVPVVSVSSSNHNLNGAVVPVLNSAGDTELSSSSLTSHSLTINTNTTNSSCSLNAMDGVEELFAISNPADLDLDVGMMATNSGPNQMNKIANQPVLLLWNVEKNIVDKNNMFSNNSNMSTNKLSVDSHPTNTNCISATEGYDLMGSNTTLTAETIYRCKRCLRTFPLYTIANYHYKTVHLGLNEYQCQWCKKLFPGCLKVHMDLCSAKRANSTPILRKKLSGDSKKSRSSKSGLIKSSKRQQVAK